MIFNAEQTLYIDLLHATVRSCYRTSMGIYFGTELPEGRYTEK